MRFLSFGFLLCVVLGVVVLDAFNADVGVGVEMLSSDMTGLTVCLVVMSGRFGAARGRCALGP